MIYIVEDDAAIRELEQYALQSSGYEVQSFETSEPFWQAMRAAEPELVILDVMLPGEDGFSILKKLRNTPALRRLPIIMVTAKSSELDTVRGLDCGADDYITKPFGIMEFLSRVRAALRRSAPEEKQNVYAFHEILLDNARHSVTVNGTDISVESRPCARCRYICPRPPAFCAGCGCAYPRCGSQQKYRCPIPPAEWSRGSRQGSCSPAAGAADCIPCKSGQYGCRSQLRCGGRCPAGSHGRKNQLPAVFHGLRRSGLHRRALRFHSSSPSSLSASL